jgi:hypothetical protein
LQKRTFFGLFSAKNAINPFVRRTESKIVPPWTKILANSCHICYIEIERGAIMAFYNTYRHTLNRDGTGEKGATCCILPFFGFTHSRYVQLKTLTVSPTTAICAARFIVLKGAFTEPSELSFPLGEI